LIEPHKKSIRGILPVDKSAGHVYKDGIHAYHRKEESPLPVPQHIDDVVEQGKEQQAKTAR